MADRGGSTVTESVSLKQATLVILAFTKGKSQLESINMEKTRGIVSIHIHIERVIGMLRRTKYTNLEGTQPTDFLACNPHGPLHAQVPMIDRILRVCSALVNVYPTIVPLTSFI